MKMRQSLQAGSSGTKPSKYEFGDIDVIHIYTSSIIVIILSRQEALV